MGQRWLVAATGLYSQRAARGGAIAAGVTDTSLQAMRLTSPQLPIEKHHLFPPLS